MYTNNVGFFECISVHLLKRNRQIEENKSSTQKMINKVFAVHQFVGLNNVNIKQHY